MNLHEVCQLIGIQLGIDGTQLYQYALEDTEGGYSINAAESTWPMGSMWKPEGQILYALIRYFDAKMVAEIGAFHGCSAAHMVSALNVTGGELYSVDVAHQRKNPHAKVHQITADGIAWLAKQADNSLDLIFEDADHSTEMCAAIANLALKKLKPGGLHLSHDAAHDFAFVGGGQRISSPVGKAIRDGLVQAFEGKFRVYLIEPSDCGFSLWRKPVEEAHKELLGVLAEFKGLDPYITKGKAPTAEKPKRKRSPRKQAAK